MTDATRTADQRLDNSHWIIKPLRPPAHWRQWPTHAPLAREGYPCESWYYPERMIRVISAVEVAVDKDGSSNGPEYHISISRLEGAQPARVNTFDAKWVLRQFGLEGAEEDNHVPHGIARNFWRPVAESLVGKECACKADEPAIVEDKGDFVWRP